MKTKTDLEVKLIGENGNIFNLLGIVRNALNRNGYKNLVEPLTKEIVNCKSYEEVLMKLAEYVIIC